MDVSAVYLQAGESVERVSEHLLELMGFLSQKNWEIYQQKGAGWILGMIMI